MSDTQQLLHIATEIAEHVITPAANSYAHMNKLPASLIKQLCDARLLGSLVNKDYDGIALRYSDYLKLTRTIGQACSSVRSLLTVHDMVAYAVEKFGSKVQKDKWLIDLAKGKLLAAFALSEPGLGSAIGDIQTHLNESTNGFLLTGNKVWISYGQIADVLLIFAKLNGKPVALLVPSQLPGVHIEAINGALGMSASMLAKIELNRVELDESHIIGAVGGGLDFVANQCLTLGRFSVACGCLGIIDACVQALKHYVFLKKTNDTQLITHQAVSAIVTDILVAQKTIALLCHNAAAKLQQGKGNLYQAVEDVMMAKYMAAKKAFEVANMTLELHGSDGQAANSALRRYFHDAKACELIEGSTQLMRTIIGKMFLSMH